MRPVRCACAVVVVAGVFFGTSCQDQSEAYVAAATISEDGFARKERDIRRWLGREIRLWGYVDHGNLYGNGNARRILGIFWSGDGPSSTTWRFNLKAEADDATGRSFPVHVRDDAGRDNLLTAFAEDALARRPTKVFLQGRLFAFEAPGNLRSHTGLYMEVPSSQAISLSSPLNRRPMDHRHAPGAHHSPVRMSSGIR
jgi:hypothetical protein